LNKQTQPVKCPAMEVVGTTVQVVSQYLPLKQMNSRQVIATLK